jgi:hypothetical protein
MPVKKYKNLGQGSEKLKQNLSKFITMDATAGKERSYNPLTDAKKPREMEEPTTVETIDRVEVPEKTTGKENKSISLLIDEEPVIVKPQKKVRTITKPITQKVEKPLAPEKKPIQGHVRQEEKSKPEVGEDFRSHSCIFSEGQLNRLRDAVFLKKATDDRKYSIKDALYEAFSMLMAKRQPCENFPDDFITYSPLVSTRQLEELYSFVYNMKAKKDPKYAMKYAIYEAIEMYLGRNI